MKKAIIVLITCWMPIFLFSQKIEYIKLLNYAIVDSYFVSVKPINILDLDTSLLWQYQDYLEGAGKKKINQSVLIEIINNSKYLDTSEWNDKELRKSILIKNKDQQVDINYVLKKFKVTKKRDLKRIINLVNNFNDTIKSENALIPTNRIIYSYSRPVFDNSGNYAVVGYNHPQRERGITLYQKNKHNWVQIGQLIRWSY
jgi:hypothetical protein